MDPKLIEAFGSYVPLAQTLLWLSLIGGAGFVFRKELRAIAIAIMHRVEAGSSLKAGPIEIGPDLRTLPKVDSVGATLTPGNQEAEADVPKNVAEWQSRRVDIYRRNRGIFLAHVLAPATLPGQLFDIYIFLVQHPANDLTGVDYAEFYFGPKWQNKVFRERAKDGLIGIVTTAYGPFLCTCRVTFTDGTQIFIDRYIDFEMGRRLHHAA